MIKITVLCEISAKSINNEYAMRLFKLKVPNSYKLSPQSINDIGSSRHNTPSKIIFFSMFFLCEFSEIKECNHYEGYLGAWAKILAKLFSVRPQYRGAHYYFYGTSQYNTSSKITLKIIFFSMFLLGEFSEIKECDHYEGYLGACAKILAKLFSVRPQYRGAHYYFYGRSQYNTSSKIIS